LRQDPILSRVKLISEPWDVGPGGYQLGHHPPGFAEWNDRFRDSIRRFWRGDTQQRAEFAARLAGSSDLFDRHARRPWASVNFAASHDGFTLADVVSYEQKHNEANGEDSRDGHNDNYSANWGAEGPSDDPKINETRGRVQRGLLATVLFSHGTPMLLAGDEFGRTQRGNNNAYCQDNEISWLDWAQAQSPHGEALTTYVARLLRIRHENPVLRCRHFLHGKEEPAPGILDIAWFDTHGGIISPDSWNDPQKRLFAVRRAARNNDGSVAILTLFLNPSENDRVFRLPTQNVATRLLIDSLAPDKEESDITTDEITVAARSAVLTKSVIEAPS